MVQGRLVEVLQMAGQGRLVSRKMAQGREAGCWSVEGPGEAGV